MWCLPVELKVLNYGAWKKLKTKIQSSQSFSSTSTLVSLGYCRTPFLPPTSEATFLGHRKLQPSATCKGQRREVWLVMDWWPFVYAKHFLSPHLTVTSSVFHHLHHLRSSDHDMWQFERPHSKARALLLPSGGRLHGTTEWYGWHDIAGRPQMLQ